MLNVSEISIRRWTNDGKLGCVRVGARRARRFRREDLQAFLESDAASGRSAAPAAGIVLEGLAIEHGTHICTIYENDLGRLKLSVPLLANGLNANELCLLIAAAEDRSDILGRLGTHRQPIDNDIRRGRLVLSDGAASAREMHDRLESVFVQAVGAGQQSIRLVSDMAWGIEQGLDLDELMAFERHYDYGLAHRFPVITLCQYDARRFSGIGVLRALKCHEDTFRYPLARFLN